MRLNLRPGRVLGFLLATIALVFSTGCSESSTEPGDPVDPGPPDPSSSWELSAEETAQALGDPDRAEDGVRSVAANLGLGVYSADGTQIFAGSETSAQDFWLYDFEIPVLARAALEVGVPFTRLAEDVAAAGASIDAEDLLAHFRSAYAAHPEAFLVALLDESGLTLEGSPESVHLTPLQEWLLFLDAFVAPPGSQANAGAEASSPSPSPTGLHLSAQASGCQAFQGAGLTPGWGIAGPPAALPAHSDPATILQLLNLRQTLVAEVQLTEERAHHLHPGGNVDVPPHTMVLTAVVGFDQFPAQVLACRPDLWGSFTGTTPGSDGTWGIPDVSVDWELSFEFFEEHGALERSDGSAWFPGIPLHTDAEGRAELIFTAKNEATGGLGVRTEDSRMVSATFDLGARLQQIFPIEHPSLIDSFIEPFHHTLPQLATVEWHEGFELWAGWSTDALASETGALAGAESQVGFNPSTRARSPADLPELSDDLCGTFTPGLVLEGLQIFEADASAGGQTAWMQTTIEKSEDEPSASLHFLGHAAGTAVSEAGSWAEAATESLHGFGFDPAVYVFHIENPGADTLQINLVWEYEGELAGDSEYSQWWVDAFLRVRSCEEADGGPDSEWGPPILGYDDEHPGPGSGVGQEIVTGELVQVQLILMAGVLANARIWDGLPDIESSASVQGSLTVSVHSTSDAGASVTSLGPEDKSTVRLDGLKRRRPARGPR